MPFLSEKRKLAAHAAKALNIKEFDASFFEDNLSIPPQANLGHLALACFKFSKHFKKSSDVVAKELATLFQSSEYEAVPAGPYVNFKFNLSSLYQQTWDELLQKKEKCGTDTEGNGKKILIEYCSPNVAKKLGFQHIRTTLIGNVLAQIYSSLGYEVIRMNFVGDWGSQFARLLAAVELWGNESLLKPDLRKASEVAVSMNHLFELYVRFHKEVDANPKLLDHANTCLQKLEVQDPKSWELWKKIRVISLAAMDETLKRLQASFDVVEGESDYIPQISEVIAEVKAKADAKLSDGAWIVEVDKVSTPALIQKKDGTTLYLTRDIAAAISRKEKYHFDRAFYVVSEQQKLHFQQLFGILKKMGHAWADSLEHLSFGTVLFGSEKMSTREGRVIFLDDLLDEAKKMATEECLKKNPELQNPDEVGEKIGIGAVIFGNLASHRKSDIEFSWEKNLSLEGETGPYVQYSVVRCNSLLEKAKEKGEGPLPFSLPQGYTFSQEEESLIVSLSRFRSALHLVTRENEPYLLIQYLIELAKNFNRFYYKHPVLQASDNSQKQFRLNLVEATRLTLTRGLQLLGISAPKQM
jgi:arginyl-tRNA synthetase